MNEEIHREDPQPKNHLRPFKVRRWLRAFAIMGVFVAALFIPAGRLDWWAGWSFLIAFFSSTIILTLWMRRRDPALMEERSRTAENVKSWDKAIMGVYTVLLFGMLVIAGLDAGRFGLSDMPAALIVLGWLGLLAGGGHNRTLQLRAPPDVCGHDHCYDLYSPGVGLLLGADSRCAD